MMRNTTLAIVGCTILALTQLALAGTITLQPVPSDLYDLDHTRYYRWGLDVDDLAGKTVTGATLRFNDIRNWDTSPNVLYVHLLDSAPLGVTSAWDGEGYGDAFLGLGPELVTYTNLPATPQDLVYAFKPAQLEALNAYLAPDQTFGLGLDPDCHFYNNGVSLELSYDEATGPPPVPEPATVTMVGLGAFAVWFRFRQRRKAKARV